MNNYREVKNIGNADIAKELTIIIPVLGRTVFTKRLMSYMDSIKIPFNIFIADSGNDESAALFLTNKENFPNLHYEYLRYSYDQSIHNYFYKINDALSRINTPFVVLLNNDDLFTLKGLKQSVIFLKSHPEYSACSGRSCIFSLVSWGGDNVSENAYGDVFWPTFQYSVRQQLEQDSAYDRVRAHFFNYAPTYFDVQRTEQLKVNLKTVLNLNPKDVFLCELITSFLTVANGKVRREPVLYLIRQRNTKESWSVSEYKKLDLFDRMLSENWSDDFTAFINVIAQEIAKKDKSNINDILPLLKKWYRIYISNLIVVSLTGKTHNKDINLISLYMALRRKLGSMMIKILRTKFWEGQVYFMEIPSKYYKDINFVRKFLARSQG